MKSKRNLEVVKAAVLQHFRKTGSWPDLSTLREQLARDRFLEANYQQKNNEQLAKALGVRPFAIRRRLEELGLTRRRLPRRITDYIQKHYATQTQSEIARALGLPVYTVKNYAIRAGLRKGPSTATRFKKGQDPWNKGIPFKPPGSEKGQFKKGNLPHNTKAGDGCITVRFANSKKSLPYQYIRLGLGKWRELHRHLWEQAHGPIPRGHLVVFRNGNTLDCRLENLELITLRENADRNRNPEKARAKNPLVNLSDNYVAFMMAGKREEKELREEIKKHPELLELGRMNMKLKREIKKHQQK
jgi:hypothetical protein